MSYAASKDAIVWLDAAGLPQKMLLSPTPAWFTTMNAAPMHQLENHESCPAFSVQLHDAWGFKATPLAAQDRYTFSVFLVLVIMEARLVANCSLMLSALTRLQAAQLRLVRCSVRVQIENEDEAVSNNVAELHDSRGIAKFAAMGLNLANMQQVSWLMRGSTLTLLHSVCSL